MKKKTYALILFASFIIAGCTFQTYAQVSPTKEFVNEAKYVIDTLNTSLKEILKNGSHRGYELLDKATITLHSVAHDAPLAKELTKVIQFIHHSIDPLVAMIKNRPTKKDGQLAYVMKFKNIDLMTTMTQLVTLLNQLHQEAVKQGHTEDAEHIKEFVLYIEKIKGEWANLSMADQSKMMENLLNSMNK